MKIPQTTTFARDVMHHLRWGRKEHKDLLRWEQSKSSILSDTYNGSQEPTLTSNGHCADSTGVRTVELLLPAKTTPLVPGASVLRALPRRELRRVGPFVLFDH